MHLEVMRKLCKKNNIKILHLNYYKTADFWIDTNDSHYIITKLFVNFLRVIFKSISYLINYPNKYLSPYIILVAKKV